MTFFHNFIMSFILALGLFITIGNIHLAALSLDRCEQHIATISAAAAHLPPEA